MTTSHIFYIPLMLLVGLVLGVVLGRRSVAAAAEEEARREERRRRRRERLAAAEGEEAPAGEGRAAP
ncbi:MAG: hypothetical protein ACQEXJ_07035 [Myxococcota bacterium]